MAWRNRRSNQPPRRPTSQELAIAASIASRSETTTTNTPSSPPLDPITATHLRSAGYDPGPLPSASEPTTTFFCICKTAYGTFGDEEKMISCDNRRCEIVDFHLACVGLPEHPPSVYGWMCPVCREVFSLVGGRGGEERKGLFEHRDRTAKGGVMDAGRWLAEAEERKKMKKMKKEGSGSGPEMEGRSDRKPKEEEEDIQTPEEEVHVEVKKEEKKGVDETVVSRKIKREQGETDEVED